MKPQTIIWLGCIACGAIGYVCGLAAGYWVWA